MLWLQLIITAVITALIVLAAAWIKRNREKHQEIYKSRGIIGGIIYIVLNL